MVIILVFISVEEYRYWTGMYCSIEKNKCFKLQTFHKTETEMKILQHLH
jgi:hypothetical protein